MSYGPPDASDAPRYTGIRTFARAPYVTDPAGVEAAIVGVPFDTATSMRPGARFGPAGIRDASLLLRPYNPAQDVTVFDLSLADLYLAPIAFYVSLTSDKDALFNVPGFADWWAKIQALPSYKDTQPNLG